MSEIFNGYCTLADFKRYITAPGQTLSSDSYDDDVINDMIETASRRIDNLTGRAFYPSIQTKSYDIPRENKLWFQDDLLEVISFLNGDGTTIASTEYVLEPLNLYPKYALHLSDVTSTIYVTDSNASSEAVLDLSAFWGYHDQYATRAWRVAGTLSAAWASTTTLTASLTAGHILDTHGGQVVKINNELLNTVSVVGDTLQVFMRGDNGSTAATHLISATVYLWTPPKDISMLALEIARVMYRARYGENVDVTSTMTPAGVVVTPRSLPVWAQEILRKYQRLV